MVKVVHHAGLNFRVWQGSYPALPFLFRSAKRHISGDIPSVYVVDTNNRCWMDDTRGGDLWPVSPEVLMARVDDSELAKIFGERPQLKPRLPVWAARALENGWTPPADFNRDDYRSDDQ